MQVDLENLPEDQGADLEAHSTGGGIDNSVYRGQR
jgi:hypothetical protein